MSEIFGEPPEFEPSEHEVFIMPQELVDLLEWAFDTEEGLAGTWDDVWVKAQEMDCVEALAQWGWANAVSMLLGMVVEEDDQTESESGD